MVVKKVLAHAQPVKKGIMDTTAIKIARKGVSEDVIKLVELAMVVRKDFMAHNVKMNAQKDV